MRAFYTGLAVTVLLVGQAHSQNVIDLSTTTCKQLFEMNREQLNLVLAWMQSNYAGADDPPRIDFDKLQADGRKLAEHCAGKPAEMIIHAADELFDK